MIVAVSVRLAILGAVLLVAGVCLWSLAAGLMVAGLEVLGAAYVVAYVAAQEGERVRR